MMKTEAGESSNDGDSSVEQTAGAPSSEHDTIDQAG
jgi:hypothetical protein